MTIAVADGVLVYASDPTPTEGELVHDFVAGQIRLAMGYTVVAAFVLTPSSTLQPVSDPGIADGQLAYNFADGSVQLLLAYDPATVTRVNAGAATAAGVAHDAQVAVSTDAGAAAAMGVGVADNVGAGFTPTEAVAVGVVTDAQAAVTVDATINAAGVSETPSLSIAVNALTAEASSDMGTTSVLTAVPDPFARTITIYDHGHTVTGRLRK